MTNRRGRSRCRIRAPTRFASRVPPIGGAPEPIVSRSSCSSLGFLLLQRFPLPERALDLARDVHRAELRPAHRAKLGALEILGGQRLVVQLARARGIERQPELLVPVERIARA